MRDPNAQRPYVDDDLTFYMQTYRDVLPLAWSLANLRKHYPRARVIVLSDGDPDPRIRELADGFAAECVYGERLYGLECGGRIVDRMFEVFLRRPTAYLFKIDTDTAVQRRFRGLPAKEGLFGSLQILRTLVSIQGGCVGVTQKSARIIHDSGILRDPKMIDHSRTWATDPWLAKYILKRGIVCTDWLLGYAATYMDQTMFGHLEVRCNWRKPINDPNRRYAVVHPFELPQDVCGYDIGKRQGGSTSDRPEIRFSSKRSS